MSLFSKLIFTDGLTVHLDAYDWISAKLHDAYEAVVSVTSVILYTVVLYTLLLDNWVVFILQVYGIIDKVCTKFKLPSEFLLLASRSWVSLPPSVAISMLLKELRVPWGLLAFSVVRVLAAVVRGRGSFVGGRLWEWRVSCTSNGLLRFLLLISLRLQLTLMLLMGVIVVLLLLLLSLLLVVVVVWVTLQSVLLLESLWLVLLLGEWLWLVLMMLMLVLSLLV